MIDLTSYCPLDADMFDRLTDEGRDVAFHLVCAKRILVMGQDAIKLPFKRYQTKLRIVSDNDVSSIVVDCILFPELSFQAYNYHLVYTRIVCDHMKGIHYVN